jgi:alpha-1,3-mannosyltransferase
MTCVFDWNQGALLFYDSWVSCLISGNLFFEVSHDEKHWLAEDMFFDDSYGAEQYYKSLPLQVYSC